MKNNRRYQRRSFTLIELIVVVMILATMAAIGTPMYFKHLDNAKVTTAKTQVKLLDQAIMDYKLDVGEYPDDANGLQALVENLTQDEKWNGPYLKPAVIPKDPWGNEYILRIPGNNNTEYEVISYGSDGQEGGEKTAADISSAD